MRKAAQKKRAAKQAKINKSGAFSTLPDYRRYDFSRQEHMMNFIVFLSLDTVAGLLFYRSIIPCLLFLPGYPVFCKERRKAAALKIRSELQAEFLTAMQSVSTALTAGYSVENAFQEAYRELRKVYEKQEPVCREFEYLTSQLYLNRNLEVLLMELAERSGIEDIKNFAQVFAAAKRSGGDLVAIIRNLVLGVTQKKETYMEIETCLASKRLEYRVMSAVPFFILLYVGVSSPGFLDGMYHNLAGNLVMTGCLIVYAAAFIWGRKIVEIEV